MAAVSAVARAAKAAQPSALISVAQLAKELEGERPPLVLDASWYLGERDGAGEFRAARIPGAGYFDINAVADLAAAAAGLPHTFPPAPMRAAAAAALGLAPNRPTVVYDGGDALFSAPRAWWTLRHMGVPTRVLDGGMRQWREAGLPLDRSPAEPPTLEAVAGAAEDAWRAPADARGRILDGAAVAALSAELEAGDGACPLLDARSPGRFAGTAPEPRPGVPPGHIPGSTSVPFPSLLDAATGRLLPPEGLRAVFAAAGVSLEGDVALTCGSGVTAAIAALAAHEAGVPWTSLHLYDDAWLGWTAGGGRVVTE